MASRAAGRDTRDSRAFGGKPPRGGAGSPLPLVLGAATGLVVCAVVLALLMLRTGRSPDPRAAAQAVCADLQAQDYASMYSALAPQLQGVGTQAEFVASQQQVDALSGKVTGCTFDVRTSDAAQAQLSFTVTRSHAGTQSGAVHLVYVGGVWKVDSYDASVL